MYSPRLQERGLCARHRSPGWMTRRMTGRGARSAAATTGASPPPRNPPAASIRMTSGSIPVPASSSTRRTSSACRLSASGAGNVMTTSPARGGSRLPSASATPTSTTTSSPRAAGGGCSRSCRSTALPWGTWMISVGSSAMTGAYRLRAAAPPRSNARAAAGNGFPVRGGSALVENVDRHRVGAPAFHPTLPDQGSGDPGGGEQRGDGVENEDRGHGPRMPPLDERRRGNPLQIRKKCAQRPSAPHRLRALADDVRAGAGFVVATLDQQPLGLGAPGRALQRKTAAELLPVEHEHGVAPFQRFRPRDPATLLVGAAIPDDHPATVGAALKVVVGQAVVLDLDGESLDRRIERRSLRDRPGAHDPVHLQPEVVVVRGGLVLLDDEDACRHSADRELFVSFLAGAGQRNRFGAPFASQPGDQLLEGPRLAFCVGAPRPAPP